MTQIYIKNNWNDLLRIITLSAMHYPAFMQNSLQVTDTTNFMIFPCTQVNTEDKEYQNGEMYACLIIHKIISEA